MGLEPFSSSSEPWVEDTPRTLATRCINVSPVLALRHAGPPAVHHLIIQWTSQKPPKAPSSLWMSLTGRWKSTKSRQYLFILHPFNKYHYPQPIGQRVHYCLKHKNLIRISLFLSILLGSIALLHWADFAYSLIKFSRPLLIPLSAFPLLEITDL